jgi:superfamily II DNA or RNA helicase
MRGSRYWRNQAVELLETRPEAVAAAVYGTDCYDVGLFWDKHAGVLEGSCTCPYFSDRQDICKHIWATILAADEDGLLTAARSAARLRLEVGFEPPFNFEKLFAESPWIQLSEPPPEPDWRDRLTQLLPKPLSLESSQESWLRGRQIVYLLNLPLSRQSGRVVFEVRSRDRKKNGDWGVLKTTVPRRSTLSHLPDPEDRQLLGMIAGAREHLAAGWYSDQYRDYEPLPSRFSPPEEMLAAWVRVAVETGRFMILEEGRKQGEPLVWDAGEPWRLALEVTGDDDEWRLDGHLTRGDERLPLSAPVLLCAAGLVIFEDRVAALDSGEGFGWVPFLRREGVLRVPRADTRAFLETLLSLPQPAGLDLPEALQYEEVTLTPRNCLTLRRNAHPWADQKQLDATLEFDYEGELVAWTDPRLGLYQEQPPRLIRRDLEAEQRALVRLFDLGVRELVDSSLGTPERSLTLHESRVPKLARTLSAEGWSVEAEGRRYRPADSLSLELTSGIDWFDLHGTARFGDQSLEVPRLLKALRRGESHVQLDDGSFGMLPEDWLERYGRLARMGTLGDGQLRFQRSQIGLLDALIDAQPEIQLDEAMARARRQLAQFSGVEPKQAPRGFQGVLREYQKEGLGWLDFLRIFGFGGCLADDMGLGKTVQVLALLESRRQARHRKSTPPEQRPGPSLVVVPKSLIFNWKSEAARFTPKIRVLDYTGTQRKELFDRIGDHDVVLTTYGTLRRDIAKLKELAFDYAILDEAQAIKNHKSATAKACRLLQSRHRLALTGTPIENHVGELMSLLDFLNPGLFGPGRQLPVPKTLRDGALLEDGTPHPELALIAGAARPFILRRTKDQVAKDLPEKVEQTLYCELTPKQRKDYDQLREHYRQSLLGEVDSRGMARSKMHVLEALLRLRQAACHPGLIDRSRRDEDSGKLALLLPQLAEVVDEGHKALVFSQFTSLLAIVRSRLDERGIAYEYLDGRTRKRQEHIRRFQEDPECGLFLISLKAGGVGLNLTAAEYVFVLDPWWNPAVEAQAIDRTHRIGQTRKVFAYSLIARDTVEEKVLELQQTKRQLADAIVRADSSLIRNLTREDLVRILS